MIPPIAAEERVEKINDQNHTIDHLHDLLTTARNREHADKVIQKLMQEIHEQRLENRK